MTTEDQYIYEQFCKNFLNRVSVTIVIYGTGIHTKRLLEKIPAKRVAGLMDRAKTGQSLFGKRVLSYEEVAALPNVCIVILARNAVINVIYRRIESFVSLHGIPVFDINGKRLCIREVENAEKECFVQKEQQLTAKIAQADVVSFDVFDTLLYRRVMKPSDVFLLMDGILEDKPYLFSKERHKAEEELPEDSNYNIYDIYQYFGKNTGETDSEIMRILKLEIETEKKSAGRREKMCSLLEQSVRQGKDVYLISDMYLDSQMMEDILTYHSITGYKKLYVSSDYQTSKQEKLFEIVRMQERLEERKWLHIGDNLFADIYAPKRYGIDTFRVYGTMEMLGQGIYAGIMEKCHSLEEGMVAAVFAGIAYQDPFGMFSGNGKLVVSNAGTLAKLLAAPLVMKYMATLLAEIRQYGDVQVLFPSRDGYLLKKIYDHIANIGRIGSIQESKYIYTSWRAALIAAAKDAKDIDFIIGLPDEQGWGICGKISRRFGLELHEEYSSVNDVPAELKEKLLNICRKERENYTSYLREEGFFQKRGIFVDLIAVGTVQDALQRITGKELYGYYFLRRRPDSRYTENLCCTSMYSESGDFEPGANIYKYYYFLENILTSFEPAFLRVGDDGDKEFFKEMRTDAVLSQVREMHDAVFGYCMEMSGLYPDIYAMNAPLDIYEEILGFFDSNLIDIAPSILGSLVNHDELLGKTVTDFNR